jgi:hypothetical protein
MSHFLTDMEFELGVSILSSGEKERQDTTKSEDDGEGNDKGKKKGISSNAKALLRYKKLTEWTLLGLLDLLKHDLL